MEKSAAFMAGIKTAISDGLAKKVQGERFRQLGHSVAHGTPEIIREHMEAKAKNNIALMRKRLVRKAFSRGTKVAFGISASQIAAARKAALPHIEKKIDTVTNHIATGSGGNLESMRRAKRRLGNIAGRLQSGPAQKAITESARTSGAKPLLLSSDRLRKKTKADAANDLMDML